MSVSLWSPIYWYGNYLRLCFFAAGLTSQITNLDNGKTTIHFWGPKFINTTKPSLVLIHGFGPVPTWQWRNQVTYFAPKFNVYVPELIFFGQSTTQLADRSEQFQADTVAKLMEKIGVKKYSVVGTSYGGFVAYNVAKRWADRVDKVVIASSATNMRLRDSMELLKRAKVEKIQDLFLPTSVARLRTLLTLTVYNFSKFVPYSLLDDMLRMLFSDNREEKSELFDGVTIGRDNQAHVVPLNKASRKECEVGGDKRSITFTQY
uniref:AB hydrolase-1 domain-containing protein n=1 Tax=Cannabis sativa TaxID=3483 RepID=A0A803NFQ7_CANSA